ncbi:hypothetical protein SS1G_09741 [Sclerotinia sclerotiorum 1980 UF-70]|uniref:C2H2-type domain-containing protein n=1 Tax=Sclerotinia sclerotiorum (strain ATCC 18683 / 1980 / Ss-1) TaxID=665079 RepID=A7EWN2_SCLS1|nr:hypothetical protein SS1G_09741 [Sclerotinia sclerotiorum 1980 UF-70]EDN93874.1 hypothetical protein SS1G_09741 [Sclerotinia sclerotiorum 1980 UF-70]
MAQIDAPVMSQIADPMLQRRPNGEIDNKNRGRRRSRTSLQPTEDEGELSHGEIAEGHTSGDDGHPRKRRRSRKGLDKKFECSTEGCGKSYSRAEHLYRHQLNHTPKQIYNCDFDGCSRTGQNTSSASSNSRGQRHPSFGTPDAKSVEFSRPLQPNVGHYGMLPTASNNQNYRSNQAHSPQAYISQQNFPPFSLPPSGFANVAANTINSGETEPLLQTPVSAEYPNEISQAQQSGPDMMLLDQMAVSNTMPVFGGEGCYNRSPCAIPEDFVAYLFSTQQNDMGQMNSQPYPNTYPDATAQYYAPYFTNDLGNGGFYPPAAQQSHHPMAVTSLLDTSLPEQFLHKPTFSPDRTPDLLLIAMMAIGASLLDKAHGPAVTEAGADLSNFLAWHLRWEIFNDHQFRPPASLWVFQALLLLEIYEKMYSTRALHERAHIHHATTITLMRRGSSLIGRSALDSPPSARDDKHGHNDSRQSSASAANTPDEWWNHWIINEATRRAAFAAFVIDSTHATMFGHSTVMVAHEMRLPLPCDEAMWTATSSAEVGRLESSLQASGMKPISFLEGLKRTLNAQDVRTNSFGRTILMAGLLSVSWHMNQRDLQVNSLGVSQALGGRDKWRGSLTRAFDLWMQDFDSSLLKQSENMPGPYAYTGKENNVVYQSRTVLHHLAHMAMHVDVVDCQIFARAKRLLGRTIGSQDLNSAQRRMQDIWAPTAKARDATFYAIKFLCTVLLPEKPTSMSHGYDHAQLDSIVDYSARDDVLLNRPWVLYFAALIVWCYGYALEGPTTAPVPDRHVKTDQARDMRAYLRRFGSINNPEELKILTGLNGCSGLLMVLQGIFQETRWELLHEAALLLNNCINLVSGQPYPPSRDL